MRINRKEIVGPVASVIRVRGYDEALHVANDTPFGLSPGIVTTSLMHASHFKRSAQAGIVMVNLPTAGVDYHLPFGGARGPRTGRVSRGVTAARRAERRAGDVAQGQKCPPVRHPEPPLSSASSAPPGSHELPVSSPPAVQGLGQVGPLHPPPKSRSVRGAG